MIMPSPRNHILDLFNLAAALSGNDQSAKSRLFTKTTSCVPKFKIQNSAAAAAEFFILTVASYHYFFDTPIKKSAAAAARFRIFNFASCHYLFHNQKCKKRPRQRPKFEF